MKILELTLKKRWFDEIKAGNKKQEYRTPSRWIFSRLEGRYYDAVRFRNGYSTTSPTVTLEYKGYELGFGDRKM